MALLIIQGSSSYALSQQDLERYPGSTLSSMVTSVAPQDNPVKLQVDELRGSPLGDWSEAASITAALYRHDHQTLLGTLSRVLATQSTDKVYTQIRALVDYLGLPETVDKLLPPYSMMSLQHLPVLDLYYHALAQQAVQLMLSTPLALKSINGFNIWPADAAYFNVSVKNKDGSPVGVDMYAVGGGTLADPTNNPATWTADANGTYTIYAGSSPCACEVSGLQGTLTAANSTVTTGLQYACSSSGTTQHQQDRPVCFGRHVEAVLKAGLNRMSLSSCSGRAARHVQSKRVVALWGPGRQRRVDLWVIHW